MPILSPRGTFLEVLGIRVLVDLGRVICPWGILRLSLFFVRRDRFSSLPNLIDCFCWNEFLITAEKEPCNYKYHRDIENDISTVISLYLETGGVHKNSVVSPPIGIEHIDRCSLTWAKLFQMFTYWSPLAYWQYSHKVVFDGSCKYPPICWI